MADPKRSLVYFHKFRTERCLMLVEIVSWTNPLAGRSNIVSLPSWSEIDRGSEERFGAAHIS